MTLCYIGLGSNLDDPEEQVRTACRALQQWPETRLTAVSSLYRSLPVGPQDQPDFINAVVALDTHLEAEPLLDRLQAQEQHQGRIRRRHWGERTIDLDILLYGDQLIDQPRLTVPHTELCNRSFVVIPLLEVAPRLTLPNGTPLASLPSAHDRSLIRLSSAVIDL